MLHTRANCRITDDMIAAGKERLHNETKEITFTLDLNSLETAAKDALSVASSYDVVRVAFSGTVYGNELVAPASTKLEGTAELFVIEGENETSIGEKEIDLATPSFEYSALLKDKTTLESLAKTKLKIVFNITASSSCSEAAPSDSSSLSKDWGRSALEYEVGGVKLLY